MSETFDNHTDEQLAEMLSDAAHVHSKEWILQQFARVRREALEEAATVAEAYAAAAVTEDTQVSKQRNSQCIAKAIRALIDKPGEG